MKKAFWIALGLALMVGATSLQAAAAPKPQITDPFGDSNFVNDQGTGDGSIGDTGDAGPGTASDLLSVTFSNDAKNLSIYVETQAAPPAITGVGFRVRVNPDGAGGTHCLLFEAFYKGANNTVDPAVAHVKDVCAGGDPVPVKIIGTTFIVPRKVSKALGKGATLKAPQAQSFLYTGTYPVGSPTGTVDTTKVGTDYKMVDKKKKR